MLPRDDVFDVEWACQFDPIRQPAILATPTGPLTHLLPELRRHQAGLAPASCWRALSCSVAITSLTSISALYSRSSSGESCPALDLAPNSSIRRRAISSWRNSVNARAVFRSKQRLNDSNSR